jgi:low temperature requirement protein LtrA
MAKGQARNTASSHRGAGPRRERTGARHDAGVTVLAGSSEGWRLRRPPRLRTLEDGPRHASYLELFFDLVFVVAIAQLAHELVVDHSLGGFATFAALYLPVFIAWQGFSIYADRFDTGDIVFRTAMLAGMLAILALAVQVPDVVNGQSTGFAVAYIVLRSLMIALYGRSYVHVPAARPLVLRYMCGYSLGVSLWVISLALPSPGRYVLWGVGLAWEYSLPTLFRGLFARIPVHASHVPERFALFTIIVLGESVVAVALGTGGSRWETASAVTAALAFLAAAAIWWIYFGSGGELEMRRSAGPVLVFTHAHIPLLAALTAVSAGITLAIEHAKAGNLDTGARWALRLRRRALPRLRDGGAAGDPDRLSLPNDPVQGRRRRGPRRAGAGGGRPRPGRPHRRDHRRSGGARRVQAVEREPRHRH